MSSPEVEIGPTVSVMDAIKAREQLARERGEIVELESSSSERSKKKSKKRSNSGSSSGSRKRDKMVDPSLDTILSLKEGEQVFFSKKLLDKFRAYERINASSNFRMVRTDERGDTFEKFQSKKLKMVSSHVGPRHPYQDGPSSNVYRG